MLIHGIDIWRWLRDGTWLRSWQGSIVEIGKRVAMKRCTIYVHAGASLHIADDARLEDVNIYVEKGSLTIGSHSIIGKGKAHARNSIIINDGAVAVGHHSKVACRQVWVRFGGQLSIGNYTNVNEGSEIRCDQEVTIGSYNQISYAVNIWDTNTHCLLPAQERRAIAQAHFPYFGYEAQRPITAPVAIGNDCWIGERATLLKGTVVGNEVNVGFGTLLTGQHIADGCTVVNETKLKIIGHR